LLTFRDFITGLRKLDIDSTTPVIAHASLLSFGEVNGGAQTILGALLAVFNTLIMPVFTYKTMITPEVGPPDNAVPYGSEKKANRMAEIFRRDMPADMTMGNVAESLRSYSKAFRSIHPILSFAGMNAKKILGSQTINNPLLPIQKLIDNDGWVLIMGVDQTVNTSIHYGEQLAGRKQFVRWALSPKGVIACPRFPGCPDGFNQITPYLDDVTRKVVVGWAIIQAIPVINVVDTACTLLRENPLALLCERTDCERCNTVRKSLDIQNTNSM
jgi:aminoglycoside 3-N-acetyltransferase